jgi:hypothetical protein
LIPTAPGVLDFATTGDFNLGESGFVTASDTYCAKGGSVKVRAEGNIALGPLSTTTAGASLTGSGCTMGDGGDITLLAGGTYAADATASSKIGAGTNAGTLKALGGQAVDVGPIEPGLIAWTTITSAPLSLEGAGAIFEDAKLTWAAERGERPVLELSLDGGDEWIPLASAVGQTLSDGWRYRVQLPTGQFDAAELDRIELSYTLP